MTSGAVYHAGTAPIHTQINVRRITDRLKRRLHLLSVLAEPTHGPQAGCEKNIPENLCRSRWPIGVLAAAFPWGGQLS